MLASVLYRRPRIEAALSALDKRRLRLPVVNLAALFDDFSTQPVTLHELPAGQWSSPVADVVMLAKIAKCLRPKGVLQIGSFRGYTTKLLAEHTGPDTRIVAFDRDARHGAPIATRHWLPKSSGALASSRRQHLLKMRARATISSSSTPITPTAVKHDTGVLLPLLAPEGIMVWHDYANWGRFSKMNGVPEALHELAQTLPVVVIGGSWLAAYSPSWSSGAGAERLAKARQASREGLPGDDPRTTSDMRG
jgi:hypothetical protein